jgi:predicted Kef-type K+ transport protein/Trk K+ transport system NAD-binding subunit
MPQLAPFAEIAAIVTLATVLGFIGQKLRQPLIIMFLATGILVGPSALGIVASYEQIELLAHIGIALLLFIVGLKLDLHLIRTIGPVALATGLGQIIFTSAIGLLIALALGLGMVEAAYVAVALTFSSTIIIVKLLSDKKEIDALHGQIALGFLIVQDIAAILALVVLTSFGGAMTAGGNGLLQTAMIAAKGLGLLALIGLLTRFVLPALVKRLARNQEMLALFAISWAIFLGAGGELLGFSKEVGAFLAGISLASSGYRDAIGARLTGLRDFLLLFFFIDLGARLDWSAVGLRLTDSLIFSLFVLIGNPLIVLVIMGAMGYRRRTAFLAGLTVAQISEFSLIVAALGLSLGHITTETMGLVTLVGVATIFASTYMILYSAPLYRLLAAPLKIFERQNPYRESAHDSIAEIPAVDVILVGLGNYGSGVAEHLLRRNKSFIGVDFDPAALERWRSRMIPVLYGDMADPEIHEQLPLHKTHWVVSTIRDVALNLSLVQLLRTRGFDGRVAVAAASPLEVGLFEKAGVHVVLSPFSDAAEQAVDALTHAMHVLPGISDWPVDFREIRIQSGAAVSGRMIREIPLRAETGASILAVSRAGRVNYEPDPEYRIYPGDRLVIMGHPEELQAAAGILGEIDTDDDARQADSFVLKEVRVADASQTPCRTLEDLGLRQKYGVTVVGIRRGEDTMAHPGAKEMICTGDRLVVIGSSKSVAGLKQMEPL